MSSFLKSEIFEKSLIKTYINQAEISLKKIYEGTGNIQDVISSLDSNEILIDTKYYEINTEKLLGSFMSFIKKQLKLANENIKYKVQVSVTNAHYYSKKLINLVEANKSSNKNKYYKRFLELATEIIFSTYDSLVNKNLSDPNKNLVKILLIEEIQKLFNIKMITQENILEFAKLNNLLFSVDDSFLKSALIINIFFIIYGNFNDYYEFLINLYYMYYRYTRTENLNEFKQEILSKIDPYSYSKFILEEKFLTYNYNPKLLMELENLIDNNKKFKLKIDEKLLNNNELLALFNLTEIEKRKIEKFFQFHILQKNYHNYEFKKNEYFDVSVDNLDYDYDTDKLYIFNCSFLIACGLMDKIETDSLQIFNEDNHSINLFKKYANILLKNINDVIYSIKNKTNFTINDEIFGFGKIFKTFFVLYTNLNNDKYTTEKLKFDLIDYLSNKNEMQKRIEKINIKLSKSETNTNFSKASQESINDLNDEQKYHEKINAYSLEENCKTYIMAHINDLINDNIDKIELLEMYKILFSLNFFIPYVDEDYCLKFKPVTKNIKKSNSENIDYGYQEFDCLFRVVSNNDIPMNKIDKNCEGLPFVKNMKIEINNFTESNPIINVDSKIENGFILKKNSLVIIENKLRFPKTKELFNEYLFLMIKKYNFVIQLIKNTNNNLYKYNNMQLLLIYDDIIVNQNVIKELISKEDIKSILNRVAFKEKLSFTIEIIYVSQMMNFYNSSYVFKKLTKDINELKTKNKQYEIDKKIMEEKIEKLERILRINGLLDAENK